MLRGFWNFNLNSLYDQTGQFGKPTNTNTRLQPGDKGNELRFDASILSKLELGNLGNLKSIILALQLKTPSEKIFEGDPNAHLIYTASGILTYPDWDDVFVDMVNTDNIVAGDYHHIVIISSTNVECTDAVLALNNTTYGDLGIAYCKVFDHQLNVAEINDDYNNVFSNLKYASTMSPKYFFFAAPPSINENGLVAAYNGTRNSNGDLSDVSGNGKHIVCSGIGEGLGVRGQALVFDGVSQATTPLNVAEDIKSFKIIVRIDNDTKDIIDFDGGTHYLKVASGVISAEGFDSPTIYVNGAPGTSITVNKWMVIEVTTATAFTVSALRLGYAGNSYFQGAIDELLLRAEETSRSKVHADYDAFASLPVFSLDLKNASADGVTKVPVGVELESGDTKIDEDAEGKYIEGISDSIIAVKGVDLNYLENNGLIKNITGDLSNLKNSLLSEASGINYSNKKLTVRLLSAQKLRSLSIITGKRTFDIDAIPSFNPIDVSDMLFWYDAALGITEAGSRVSRWDDQSGGGHDLVQGVAAKQPLWQANQINGLPAVKFNGTDENMYNNPPDKAQPFVYFMVVTEPTDNGAKRILISDRANAAAPQFYQNGADNKYYIQAAVGHQRSLVGAPFAPGTWRTYTLVFHEGNSVAHVNGINYALSLASPGAGSITRIRLATNADANNHWGDINLAELICYFKAPSDEEISNLEIYLLNKYAHY